MEVKLKVMKSKSQLVLHLQPPFKSSMTTFYNSISLKTLIKSSYNIYKLNDDVATIEF